jgi:excisionase family DNA binding protein
VTQHTQRLLSRREACEYLGGIGPTHLWDLERRGLLSSVRIGRRVLFLVEDLESFITKCRKEGRSAAMRSKDSDPSYDRA